MSRLRRLAPTLLLLAAAACGGAAGDPAAGVVHLDLRLADGSSPSHALASALPVREVRPRPGDPASLGPWKVEGGRLAGGAEGARLIADGEEPPRFVLRGKIDAADFPLLELIAETRKPTDARVRWSGAAGSGELAIEAQPDDRPRRVAFAVGADPTWSGTIDELSVTPSSDGTAVLVHVLRLVPMGFQWGSEPLAEEDRAAAGQPGDAGLRRRGYESRRAWPSDLGVPLFATVERVPRGGVLATAVAPGNNALGKHQQSLFAAVDGREPGGSWRRLATLELPPARTVMTASWEPLTCDLSDYAGGPVELRFVADFGAAPAPDAVAEGGKPALERVLWGAPEIVGEPPASRRPNVVLVTLDTTRADALGGEFTPFFDRFGDDAVVFTNAWASCNSTTPSHASILTGLHVEEHGAITNRHLLGPEVRTLAEELRGAGYHTAAAVSVPHIQAGVGFGQGFDAFALAQPGAEVNGAYALRWVERWTDEWSELPPRPYFLWVHLFDPHTPYSPPSEWVKEFLAESGLSLPSKEADPATIPVYVGPRRPENVPLEKRWLAGVSSLEYSRFVYALGVAYADHLCEQLFDGLERAGQLDGAAVFLSADHGESLGEHNVWFNHAGLFRETLNVPLLVRFPNGPRGVRIEEPVSNIDIAPTILRLAAVAGAPELPGLDLERIAQGESPPEREVWFAFNGLHQAGFRDRDTHFFTTLTGDLTYGVALVEEDGKAVPRRLPEIPVGTSFLYDPHADPALVNDVAAGEEGRVDQALSRLGRWRESLQAAKVQRRNLTASEEAGLAGLGYAGD